MSFEVTKILLEFPEVITRACDCRRYWKVDGGLLESKEVIWELREAKVEREKEQ